MTEIAYRTTARIINNDRALCPSDSIHDISANWLFKAESDRNWIDLNLDPRYPHIGG